MLLVPLCVCVFFPSSSAETQRARSSQTQTQKVSGALAVSCPSLNGYVRQGENTRGNFLFYSFLFLIESSGV